MRRNAQPANVSPQLSRIHRWVGLPVLAFALGMTVLWAWKQHLTRQLRDASADQQLDRCLRLERRLQPLEWVPSPPAEDAGRCRREAAQRLWGAKNVALALRLQQELVRSSAATSEDLQQLRLWKAEVQRSALRAFDQGELERSLALLRLSDTAGGDPGVKAMTAQLREIWGRNAQEAEANSALARRVPDRRYAFPRSSRPKPPCRNGSSRFRKSPAPFARPAQAGNRRWTWCP